MVSQSVMKTQNVKFSMGALTAADANSDLSVMANHVEKWISVLRALVLWELNVKTLTRVRFVGNVH